MQTLDEELDAVHLGGCLRVLVTAACNIYRVSQLMYDADMENGS